MGHPGPGVSIHDAGDASTEGVARLQGQKELVGHRVIGRNFGAKTSKVNLLR